MAVLTRCRSGAQKKRPGRAPSLALPGHTTRTRREVLKRADRSRAGFLVRRRCLGLVGSDRGRADTVASTVIGLHAQQVLDVAHADHAACAVLGVALGVAIVHAAGQRDLAVLDRDLDARSIDLVVVGQRFADQLADPLVRALITRWPLAAVRPGAAMDMGLAGVARHRVGRGGVAAVRTRRIPHALVATAVAAGGIAHALLVTARQAAALGLEIAAAIAVARVALELAAIRPVAAGAVVVVAVVAIALLEAARGDRVVAPRWAELAQAVLAATLRAPAVIVVGKPAILPRALVALVVAAADVVWGRFILRTPARLALVRDGDVAPSILMVICHGGSPGGCVD